MTAEEIIDRLLDERKITSKEAIILLKAIAKEVIQQWIPPVKQPSDATTDWPYPNNITTVMYGVVPPNVIYNERDKNIETTFWVSDHNDDDDL